MAAAELTAPRRPVTDQSAVVHAVDGGHGTVVGLTFPVWLPQRADRRTAAWRAGLVWVAPLVAPAVGLAILGLLLGTRPVALNVATATQLRRHGDCSSSPASPPSP